MRLRCIVVNTIDGERKSTPPKWVHQLPWRGGDIGVAAAEEKEIEEDTFETKDEKAAQSEVKVETAKSSPKELIVKPAPNFHSKVYTVRF